MPEKTRKLYDMQPYETTFTAKVLSCQPGKNDLYEAILDQTLFFPEEGGQTADCGTLCGRSVCDVQIKDGVITHMLQEPLTVGLEVKGCIDWEIRFSNMQQHTGEHILSGLVHKQYGYRNVGFHLSAQTVTLDFDGFLEKAQVSLLERAANEVIASNVPVTAAYPDASLLQTLSYRSKTTITEAIRIVTIEGCDVCACCAPHVRRTGEIGLLKIIDSTRYKGGIRLQIVCGLRALAYVQTLQEQADKVSVLLSVSAQSFSDGVFNLKEENFRLKGRLMTLQSKLAEEKIAALPKTNADVCLFFEELDQPLQVKYTNQLSEAYPGICAVFVGSDIDGYRYMIGSKQTDVCPISKLLQSHFPSKGGGSAVMIQGHVTAPQSALLSQFPSFIMGT